MWRAVTVQLFGHDAFISHSHADGAGYAADLFEQLELRDLRVALDKHDFQLGEALAPRMHRDVRRSRHLILLDTPFARESVFVAREVAHAVAHRRPIIRIGSPDAGASDIGGWRLLTPSERGYLAAAISREDTPSAFAAGACSAAVVSQIRSSIGVFTVRRRVRALLMLVTSLAVLASGSYLASRWLATQLQALSWTLERPERSLDQSRAEVAAFAGGVGGLAAEQLYPEEFDALLDRALSLALKPSPNDPQAPALAVAPSARTVLTRAVGDGALVVRRDAGEVRRCSPVGVSGEAQFGVADSGARLVSVDRGVVNVWNTADCSHPIAATTVAAASSGAPRLAIDPEAAVIVLVWPDRLVRLTVDVSGRVTSDVLKVPAIATEVPGEQLGFRDARLSGDGSALVFALSGGGSRQVFALCLVTPVVPTPACTSSILLPGVMEYALDASGQYLVTSDDLSVLKTWRLDVFRPVADYPPAPVASRSLGVSVLAAAYDLPAVLALDRISHALTAFDVPTLAVLGRRMLTVDHAQGGAADERPAPTRGLLRHPGYVAIPVDAFPHQPCGEPPALPMTPVDALNYSADCTRLAVLVRQADQTTLSAFDVRKVSTFRAPRFILRARRTLQGLATDVQFDRSGAWVDVLIRNDAADTALVQRVPLSRRAVVESLKESGHGTVAGWVLP